MVWQSNTLGPQHLQHQPSIFTPPGVLKAKPNPSHLWTGGSPQVAPTGDWRSTLPSGNQTWLAQKTPINCVKIVYERWIFRQCTVCLPHTHIYICVYIYICISYSAPISFRHLNKHQSYYSHGTTSPPSDMSLHNSPTSTVPWCERFGKP